MDALMLDVSAIGGLTDDELFALCASNKMLRIERTSQGEIMLMELKGAATSIRSVKTTSQLVSWKRRYENGIVFAANTGFCLPSGAMRSPDAAFIVLERWEAIPKEERKKFAPICPDFIAELRSENDSIAYLQKKISEEWIANGCRLAWLIDPFEEVVYVYRQDGSTSEVRGFDNTVSGEDVLPDFVLELKGLR
jgi:Uma2 family endonuclease